MSDLPILEPRKPIAKCGVCGDELFPGDDWCKSSIKSDSCPLKGDQWRAMERMRAMQNTYVGVPHPNPDQ